MIHDNYHVQWKQCVQYDESIRDLSQFGIRGECFVSKSCLPLTELAASGFNVLSSDADVLSCDSGHCFI